MTTQAIDEAISLARDLARANGEQHIVLDNAAVLLDIPENRECDMGAAIVYIARPNGIDWCKPGTH